MFAVYETFASIQGESTYAGLPCFFIRFAGCNLRCAYCDTVKAQEASAGKMMSENDLLKLVEENAKGIDWEKSDIVKIRKTFKLLEEEIKLNKKISLIILGKNIFMQKVNKALDLWVKNNMDELEFNNIELNIINCFSFEENENIDKILDSHEYILKTSGIEELLGEEELLKAN